MVLDRVCRKRGEARLSPESRMTAHDLWTPSLGQHLPLLTSHFILESIKLNNTLSHILIHSAFIVVVTMKLPLKSLFCRRTYAIRKQKILVFCNNNLFVYHSYLKWCFLFSMNKNSNTSKVKSYLCTYCYLFHILTYYTAFKHIYLVSLR